MWNCRESDDSLIYEIIRADDADELERMISQNGWKDILHENIERPLRYCATNGKTRCLKILLDNGANPNVLSCLAIKNALYNGHDDCTVMLSEYITDPFDKAELVENGLWSHLISILERNSLIAKRNTGSAPQKDSL